MGLYKDHGAVMRTMRLGEADRIVTILTHDHGKIRAVVKGVRKTKSRFGARLDPFGHVDLMLWEGRGELHTVSQAEILASYADLRDDYDAYATAQLMCEATDVVAPDSESNPRLLKLLLAGWRSVAGHVRSGTAVPHVLRSAFLLKLLGVTGFAPGLRNCMACGGEDGLSAFGIEAGGVLCSGCRSPADVSLAPVSVRLLQDLWRTPLDAIKDVHAGEVDGIVARAAEYHLDRRLRSLAAT